MQRPRGTDDKQLFKSLRTGLQEALAQLTSQAAFMLAKKYGPHLVPSRELSTKSPLAHSKIHIQFQGENSPSRRPAPQCKEHPDAWQRPHCREARWRSIQTSISLVTLYREQ